MIETEDYVRINGIIGSVEQIGNSLFWLEDGSSYSLDDKAIKHSKNIIDLIEEGDFVNGYKIIAINYKENYITIQNINEFDENGIKVLQEDEIKTILTKEQMEANCYTLERREEC